MRARTSRYVGDRCVSLDVVDTPGQHRFKALCAGFVARAHGLAVVLEVFKTNDGPAVIAAAWADALEWLGSAPIPKAVVLNRTGLERAGLQLVHISIDELRVAAGECGATIHDAGLAGPEFVGLREAFDTLSAVCLTSWDQRPHAALVPTRGETGSGLLETAVFHGTLYRCVLANAVATEGLEPSADSATPATHQFSKGDVVEVFDLMQSEDTPQCRARTQCGWVDVVTCSGVTAFEIFMDEDRVDPSPTELPSTDVAAVTAEEDAEIEAWASRLTQDMEQYLTGGPGRASPVKAAVAPAVPEALAAPTALADSFVMAFVEASLSETVQMETTSAEISNQPEPMPTEAPAAAPKPLDLGDTSASDVISSYGPSNVISNAISEMMDSSSDDDEFLDVSSDHVSVSDEHVLEELSPTSPLAASPLATSPAPATRGELRRLQAQQRQWEQQHEAAASAEDMPGVGAEPEPEPEPEPELEPEPSVSTPDTSITAATGCTMGEALVPVGEAATQPTGRARAGRARKGRTRAVGVQEGGGARAGEAAAAVAGKVSELGEEVEAEVELPAVHGAFDMLDAMLNGGGLPDFEPELESGSLLALEPEPEPEPEPEREPGRVRTGRARVGRIRGGGHSRGVGQVAEEGGGTREGEEEVQKGPLDRPSFQAATAEIAASTEAGTEASELSRGEQVKALLSSESSAKAADMLSDIHASDENRLGVGAGSSQASNCLELPDSDTCILGPPASRGGAEGNPRSVFARKWRADSPKPHGRDIESPTRDRRPGPTEASRAKISSPGLSPIRKAIQDRRRSTVKAYDLSQSRKNLDELAQARQQMEDFLDLTRQTCETKRAAGPLSSSGRKSFGGSISSSISSPPRVASAVPGRYRPPSTMSSAAKKLFRAEPRGFGSTSPQRGERTAATTSSSTSATSPSRPPPRVAALAKAAVGQPRSRSPRSQRGFGSSSGRGLSPQPSEADSESPSRPPRVARLTRRASEQPSAKASTRSPVRKGFGSSTARGLSPDPDRSVTRRVSSPPSAAELFSICGDTAISTARKRVVIGRAATPTVPTGFGSSSRRNTSPTAWGRVEEPAGSTAGARSSSSSRRRPSPGSASSPAAVVFVARLSQPSKRAVSPRSKSSALPTGFGSSTARRTMLSHREPAAVGGGRGSPAETAARRRRSGSPRPAAGPPSATAAEQKVGVPSLPLKRASSRDRVVGAMPGVEAACHLPDLLDDEGNSLDQSEAADPTLGDTSFGSLESTSPLDQSSRLLQPTGSSRRRGKRKGAAVGGGGARPKSAGPRACSPAAVRSLDRLCRPTGTVRGHIIDAAAAGELENTFQPAVNDRSAQLVSRRQLDPATAPVHEKLQQEAATMSARRVELVERGLAAKEAELLIKPMPAKSFANKVGSPVHQQVPLHARAGAWQRDRDTALALKRAALREQEEAALAEMMKPTPRPRLRTASPKPFLATKSRRPSPGIRRQRAPSPILATSPRINANDVAFVDPVPDVFSPTGRAAAGTPQGGGGEVRFRQEV